jgi:hypothetical protein
VYSQLTDSTDLPGQSGTPLTLRSADTVALKSGAVWRTRLAKHQIATCYALLRYTNQPQLHLPCNHPAACLPLHVSDNAADQNAQHSSLALATCSQLQRAVHIVLDRLRQLHAASLTLRSADTVTLKSGAVWHIQNTRMSCGSSELSL